MRSCALLVSLIGTVLACTCPSNAATIYVATNSLTDGPGSGWADAYWTIQGAIEAAATNDSVLVTNGVYATGGKAVYGNFTNRVAVTKPILVQSVNGPSVTTIVGAGPVGADAVRCAYVGTNAFLCGFTLTNSATRSSGDGLKEQSGGGAWCEAAGTVSNCILTGCSASWLGGGSYGGTLRSCTLAGNAATMLGGGSYDSTLHRCTLTGNSAPSGGGVYGSRLYNCVLAGNSADYGGGSYDGRLYNCTAVGNTATTQGGGSCYDFLRNCIVYFNNAGESNNVYNSALIYSCTTPGISGGGSITNDPSFMDWAAGNCGLRYGSPCIDAGTNLTSYGVTEDITGLPRPVGAKFDMGAYEYNPPTADSNGDGIPDWWCLNYGLNPNVSGTATNDPDSDTVTTWSEWIAGTDPTNGLSYLEVLNVYRSPSVLVEFLAVDGRNYTLECRTNLLLGGWTGVPGQSNMPGIPGTSWLVDTNTDLPASFYRVKVALP